MSLSVQIEKRLGGFSLDVTFETEKSVLGILGASGCGKSYTLKCIAGIERPDKGRIVLNGRVLFDSQSGINLPPQKRNVGYLFQNYALFPNMTVRQNILCGLKREKNKQEREKKISEVIDLLQLRGLERLKPNALSGGQAQRTALARILVNDVELLMLDEPFSALDSHLRDKLQIELKELLKNRFDREVIMVTHSRDEAYRLCQSILVMKDGKAITKNETTSLFADPASIAAAELAGCKNIFKARKTGDFEVEIPEWNLRLVTSKPVKENLLAVGVRAHHFSPKTDTNRAPVDFLNEMQEPFETIFEFRWNSQDPDSVPVWWRVPKGEVPKPLPQTLGLSPENVLLLYN